MFERGIDICHETVRQWWMRFGTIFAAMIKKRRIKSRNYSRHCWHLDEVFVRVNGERAYLWRAVDHEGAVLDVVVTRRRDKETALKLLRKLLKNYGTPRTIVTDGLRSYPAALRDLGLEHKQYVKRWANNRAENSHLPFRRREYAMLGFRKWETLENFTAVHSSIYNHLKHERHLISRTHYKERRSLALAAWKMLAA